MQSSYTNLMMLSSIRSEGSARPAETCLKFGISADLLAYIIKLTDAQIDELAKSDFLMFKPALSEETFMKLTGIPDPNERRIIAGLSKH